LRAHFERISNRLDAFYNGNIFARSGIGLNTKIIFRVDASLNIGTGHVMRCLTLAKELRQMNTLVVFVCREHPGNLCNLIASCGFEVIRFNLENDQKNFAGTQHQTPHSAWLDTDQETDAAQTLAALESETSWDWLVVDHYALDYRWESALRKVADSIMVIDDLADRKHDCDLLLDQNYFQSPDKRYNGIIPQKCETLLGPNYALLRPEFREARKFCRMRGNGVARVLVYFGGNDHDNLTGMALSALNSPELKHLLVDAVIGPNNPHQDKLETLADQRGGTRLHIQPEGFTELLLRADLCIGAGGTTTWERLCLGLPSLVITVAKNQEAFNIELNRDGLVSWIGKKENVSSMDIKINLLGMMEKLKEQPLFSDRPYPVDGLGALRTTEKMIASDVKTLNLRKAVLDDMELFYYWANDPAVRKNSFAQDPIGWQDHISWFTKKLESSNTLIWVLQTATGLPVGQVRFEINDGIADIAYSLDSLVRGRGWGKALLKMGIDKFKKTFTDISYRGRVKSDNLPSRRCFQKLQMNETPNGEDSIFHLE
jgi:UDP-2,4-diacetamido-2,4,6-trideoxy-beta-L-altropyranose hydrolase